MVEKIISRGKKILTSPQTSVLSAASVIMIMVIASRVLGLIRQRVLAHFFAPADLSLFFAAFRLPDLVFEVLVFGTFSSAFIPVFTKTLKKGNHKAWDIASTVMNIGLGLFIILAIVIGLGADPLYGLFAPGYSPAERVVVVKIARVLFAAQGFFVISYVLTSVLESLRRFLVPALAPLFYNIGIILGTIFLSQRFGLMGPAFGVLVGAFAHFAIQLPLATKLGFRFRFEIKITKEVKKIGRLALPRIVEVSFLQLSKMAELFFASLITTASYTYFTFGNTLRFLPVGLFGVSIAKAALPTLSRESGNLKKFKKTLLTSLHDVIFLVLPIATILIVLRIPIVRLIYGTDIFSWEATVQTGLVVSAFAVGVVFESAVALLARSFYALHDTKTPVVVSIISILLIIAIDYLFISVLGLSVWGLAAAFSIGVIFQAIALFILLNKKLKGISAKRFFPPVIKSLVAALTSGGVMYFILKVFDRSVWVKRLSFLGKIEQTRTFPFERFVLDTRYTINLLILTLVVSLVGALVYLGVALILRTDQVWRFFGLIKRVIVKRRVSVPAKGQEIVSPPTSDTASN